jgi:hypothetical protein
MVVVMVKMMMMIIVIILIKDITVQLHPFLTSNLDGGEWSASCLGCFMPLGKEPPIPIELQTGWTPEPVWLLERRGFLPLLRNRLQFWSCPACSIVILGTKLDKS